MKSAVSGKTGVLIVNLGTPDSTRTSDVRKYLRQFLMDRRVIDIPFLSRWFLVNCIIAPFRAPKSAAIYRKVWLPEGSPLKVYGYSVEKKLQEALGEGYVVKLGMRYQDPSIESALSVFEKAHDIEKIVVIPFFPQYASATTGSVHEEVMRVVSQWQVIPEIRFVNSFYDHPGIIRGFAESAREQLEKSRYDHFVFSYHGLPERQLVKAYPDGHSCEKSGCRTGITAHNRHCYLAQCYATTALLAGYLDLPSEKISTCFQSRLGKDPWIQPYTEDVVKDLAGRGIKKVLAFSPAFVADCLETTEEVGEEYKEMFMKAGGEQWDLVLSLNESRIWIETLEDLVKKY
ncbi:MAG: ferrochelatase [Cytophagaceae bacterium SCN 52-12]|nr:MAG: ferrochelatase [Cytophagaceae bacterium SCN 52-12]